MAATAAVTATDTLRSLSKLEDNLREYNELLRQERKEDRAHNEQLHREATAAREMGFKLMTEAMAQLAQRTGEQNAATRELQLSHERDEAKLRLKVALWALLAVLGMAGTLAMMVANLMGAPT